MKYRILDYSRGIILSDLTSDEVCAICKAMMHYTAPSFDIVTHNNEFVTGDFNQICGRKDWVYNPVARAEGL